MFYFVGMLTREVNKAFCGFMPSKLYLPATGGNSAVATGKWGCGAFNGDPRYNVAGILLEMWLIFIVL